MHTELKERQQSMLKTVILIFALTFTIYFFMCFHSCPRQVANYITWGWLGVCHTSRFALARRSSLRSSFCLHYVTVGDGADCAMGVWKQKKLTVRFYFACDAPPDKCSANNHELSKSFKLAKRSYLSVPFVSNILKTNKLYRCGFISFAHILAFMFSQYLRQLASCYISAIRLNVFY